MRDVLGRSSLALAHKFLACKARCLVKTCMAIHTGTYSTDLDDRCSRTPSSCHPGSGTALVRTAHRPR
eukprot:1224481-Rhodomonas_salina.5